MAKRGKAKQEVKYTEGFRSGLDFGKARALHLLRMMNEGFEDAINDEELWHEVKLKEGEDEMKAKQATAELQAKTVQFCIKYMLEAWEQPGEQEDYYKDNPGRNADNIVKFKEDKES